MKTSKNCRCFVENITRGSVQFSSVNIFQRQKYIYTGYPYECFEFQGARMALCQGEYENLVGN